MTDGMMDGMGGAGRGPDIQRFLDALFACLADSTRASAADRAFVAELAGRLAERGQPAADRLGDPPEVLRHLPAALAGLAEATPAIRDVGAAFAAIAASVPWSKRRHDGPDAARFASGHGNALIIGPGGAETRRDVTLGVSLMAPYIRYPDHAHPPDELYLVLCEGEWRQGSKTERAGNERAGNERAGTEGESGWRRLGVGGTVRNPPGVVHAMRAGAGPLLAVWALID
jgi:hypothetical protein